MAALTTSAAAAAAAAAWLGAVWASRGLVGAEEVQAWLCLYSVPRCVLYRAEEAQADCVCIVYPGVCYTGRRRCKLNPGLKAPSTPVSHKV